MDKSLPPVSIEKFAAYLDGNLPESQMHEIDSLIAHNPIMEELAEMSDVISEDTLFYLNDDFAYEADMTMIDEQDFEFPALCVEDEPVHEFVNTDDTQLVAAACIPEEDNTPIGNPPFDNFNNDIDNTFPLDDNIEPDAETFAPDYDLF